MDICSVLIMVGPLMGVDLVFGSLRLHRRGRKLELLGLQELVPLGFRRWCPRVCSSSGRMRMAGNELEPPSLLCNQSFFTMLCLTCIFNITYYPAHAMPELLRCI